MKLKPETKDIRIKISSKSEGEELIALLNENGCYWGDGESIGSYEDLSPINCFVLIPTPRLYKTAHTGCMPYSEFKEKYVIEDDKPQPKFKVGDKVRIIQDGTVNPDYVDIVDEIESIALSIRLKNTDSNWFETCLEPYTKPETKPTEDMGENKEVNKELNLCELLREGDTVYSLVDGIGKVELLDEDGFRLNNWCFRNDGTIAGSDSSKAKCLIFPSRALYEQYPLDPYTAWMKWQEEQTIYHIRIEFQPYDERGEMKCGNMGTLHFDDLKLRTPSDRDKCIGEIKAIINKYSKK